MTTDGVIVFVECPVLTLCIMHSVLCASYKLLPVYTRLWRARREKRNDMSRSRDSIALVRLGKKQKTRKTHQTVVGKIIQYGSGSLRRHGKFMRNVRVCVCICALVWKRTRVGQRYTRAREARYGVGENPLTDFHVNHAYL